jgi:hypothetical protein
MLSANGRGIPSSARGTTRTESVILEVSDDGLLDDLQPKIFDRSSPRKRSARPGLRPTVAYLIVRARRPDPPRVTAEHRRVVHVGCRSPGPSSRRDHARAAGSVSSRRRIDLVVEDEAKLASAVIDAPATPGMVDHARR